MALVAGYSSDEDDEYTGPSVAGPSTIRGGPSMTVQAAPEVSLEVNDYDPPSESLLVRMANSLGSNAAEANVGKAFR